MRTGWQRVQPASIVTLKPLEIGERFRAARVKTTDYDRSIEVVDDDAIWASCAAVTTSAARISAATALRTAAAGRCLHRGPGAGQREGGCDENR